MRIFVDESGDLGWTLDKPNRHGGSSRFITITGFVIDENDEKYINRFITDIYKKHKLTPNIEKKGASFTSEHSFYITSQLHKIYSKNNSFKIISITVNKLKVYKSLRKDKNIFYNYVLGLLLESEIVLHNNIEIVLHNNIEIVLVKRTIKVSHGESFPDYIKTKIWSQGLDIPITCTFVESTNHKMIWFADWYANFVWRNYENNDLSAHQHLITLSDKIFSEKKLFF